MKKSIIALLIFLILLFNFSFVVKSDSAGPNSPGNVVDDSSVGDCTWNSPEYAKLSDDKHTKVAATPLSGFSHYLKATNFGFSIPSGATINGIKVEIERHANGDSSTRWVKDWKVYLLKNGNVVGDNKADTSTKWPTSDAYKSYGGSSDLWGTTWTPSDINNANFGVVLAVQMGTGIFPPSTAYVDHIRITVYYTIEEVNNPPTVSNPNPANGSIDVPVSPSGVTCSAYFADEDGDTLNISWYYSFDGSIWYYDGTDTNKPPNATYSHTYSWFTEEGTTYYWKVQVNDSEDNISSDIWHFRTSAPHLYVICNSSDYDLAMEYKNWKEGNTTYTVIVKTIDDIVNNPDYWATGKWGDKNSSNPWYVEQSSWTAANGYNDTACKVRNYIRNITYNDDAIAAVLLFGKDVYRKTRSSDVNYQSVATVDMWYFGALNGTQNKDDDIYFCESSDDMSDTSIDVVIGRVPFETDSQFYAWFNKTKSYELRPYDAPINRNVILYSVNITTAKVTDELWTDYLNYTYFNILDNVGYLRCPESPGFDHCVDRDLHQSSEMTEYLNGTHEGYTEGFYMYLIRAHAGMWWEDPNHSPNDGCFNYSGAEEKAFIAISTGCGDNAWLTDIYQDQLPVLLWQQGGAVMTIGNTMPASGDHVYMFIKYAYSTNRTFGESLRALLNDYPSKLTNYLTFCLLGDPTLRPKYPKYPNIVIHGPTMQNNTFSIPGHPYAEFTFIDFEGRDIDSAYVSFLDGTWHVAEEYTDEELTNCGTYNVLYDGCSSPDTRYKINVTCSVGSTTSKAVMNFKTHPNDAAWEVLYIERNDSLNTEPLIHGALFNLNYAYYYKFEGLVNSEWKVLEEGVSYPTSETFVISNTSFMNSPGNYTLKYTFSASGRTISDIFFKTVRTNYPTSDVILVPNDNGSVSDDSITANGATYKWQCIDDGSSHDGDTTYIETTDDFGRETFNFENTTHCLDYIKITAVLKVTELRGTAYILLREANRNFMRIARFEITSTTYQEFSIYLTKNPYTGNQWTAENITDLEIGLRLRPLAIQPTPKIRCTSLYIEGAIRNTPPTLSNPSITPSSGVADYTVFYFNITYSDPDGNPPAEIKVNISKTGWYINATMTYISGDNTTGALYSYSTTLSAGVYDYLFYASDGIASTVNDPTDQVTVMGQSISFTVSTADPSGQENFTASAIMGAEWNVSASCQTSSIPAIQITNTGNVPINISINLTTTPISNVHIKYNTSSTPPSFTTDPYSCDKELTTTPVQVGSYIQPGDTLNIWLWADFENKYNPGEYTTSLWIESSGAT